MRAFGLLGLLITALLVAWAASRTLQAPVAVPAMPSVGDARTQGSASTTVPMTQVPQQVQRQVDAMVQQQADQQRQAVDQAERGDNAK